MPFIFLSILIFASALLHLRAEHLALRRQTYIFKPLTLVLIILLALVGGRSVSSGYKAAIVAGLFFSLAGDIFLMLPADRFIAGLVSFLLAHLCYITAFTIDGARRPSLPAAILLLVYGVLMLRVLWPHLGSMRLPVVIYMLVIMGMAWQALNRWALNMPQRASAHLAALGVLAFVASDSILAVNRFRDRLPHAQLLIMSTYFTAQWLIALSV